MLFHTTFLDIVRGIDPLEEIYNNLHTEPFNFDILPKTTETVEKIAPFLLQRMKKEQELIDSTIEYYIARDLSDNTVYLCFKNLLIIDIDNSKLSSEDLQKHLSQHSSESFTVYQNNKGGYHVFCTSKTFDYRNSETVSFMLQNFCDFYYTAHSYIRGFCVRLNNKFNSSKYSFEFDINSQNAKQELVHLVKFHEQQMEVYMKLDCAYPKEVFKNQSTVWQKEI